MKTIPDDTMLADWLERELAGLELADLVIQLSLDAPGPPSPNPVSIKEILGRHLDEVLERGLKVLSPDFLRENFLDFPRRLHDLHELVWTEGGIYWENLGRAAAGRDSPPELLEMKKRIRQELQKAWAKENRKRFPAKIWLAAGVLAASLVLGLLVFFHSPVSDQSPLVQDNSNRERPLVHENQEIVGNQKGKPKKLQPKDNGPGVITKHEQPKTPPLAKKESGPGKMVVQNPPPFKEKEKIPPIVKKENLPEKKVVQNPDLHKEEKNPPIAKYEETELKNKFPQAKAGPAARFVSVKHLQNVNRQGQPGILITTKCEIDGLRNQSVRVCAFFNFRNGPALKAKPGFFQAPNGEVTSQVPVVPRFNLTDFDNLEIFLPFSALNREPGKHDLVFHLEIQYTLQNTFENRVILLADSGDYEFTFDFQLTTHQQILSRWSGKENLPGYGDLTFEFFSENRIFMIDKDGRTEGTWTKAGNEVTLLFHEGRVVYQGREKGEMISGTVRNGRTTWDFEVFKK